MVGLNIPKSFSDPFQGWSEERKRFFHQYGYDRGPGVISPGEGFRSPVGKPKVRQIIKETDDDKPNVRTTTIDFPEGYPDQASGALPGEMWRQSDQMVGTPLGRAYERQAPEFERDQFTRAGMGGFTGGAQRYDMAADPSWSAATAVNAPQPLHGEPVGQRMGEDVMSFQDYPSPLGGLLASPEIAGYGESIGAMPPMGYGESIGAMPPYESPAPGVQFDEYAPRRGEGGMAEFDERDMQQYWQDVARRKKRQQNIGAPAMAQQYEGGDETDNIMNAIMMAESRGDPLAHNPGTPENPEDSLGLYQVNWDVWGKGGEYEYLNSVLAPLLNGQPLTREHLFNPEINRAAAEAIRKKQGLQAWSTYNDGTYLQHLEQAEDPNLLQRAGSGVVEGIKSAWGEPTTKSGVGFDKPPHTAETPDFTREDAPEGIPQEIYNQLRDNHHFGSQLGVISEAGAAEGALPGSSYIGQDDREAALAFQTERDRRKRIQDQMAQGQMPPPRYEDAGLLGGPSEAELAESTARMTSPALAARQQTGQDYHQMDVLKPTDPSLRLAEQDYIAGAPDVSPSNLDMMNLMVGGNPLNQTQFVDDDGQPVSLNDIMEIQMAGLGGGPIRFGISMLKNLRPAQLKALWQKFKARGTPTTKPHYKSPDEAIAANRAMRYERFKNLNQQGAKTAEQIAREKAFVRAGAATVATLGGKSLLDTAGIDLFEPFPPTEQGAGGPFGKYADVMIEGQDKPLGEQDTIAGLPDLFQELPPGLLETPAKATGLSATELARQARTLEDDESGIAPSALRGGALWTQSDAKKVASENLDANRIWANFPRDIDGKRERYLQALREIYKKIAILNVIAALTNSPSMAPQFMELAAARFEKLEGFEGEERLRDIAKGVYFTKDGRFDPPKGKREAFERAMEFGASLEEAKTISGYMPEGKETKYPTTKIAIGPKGGRVFATEEDIATQGLRPEARTTADRTSQVKLKHDELTDYLKEYQKNPSELLQYKIQTLQRDLEGAGAAESDSDLYHRLYSYYKDEYTRRGRLLETIKEGQTPSNQTKPTFPDWLENEGAVFAAAHLGEANFRSRIKDLVRAADPIWAEITKEVMDANPKPADVSHQEYNRKIMQKVEEVYLDRHG